MNEFNDTEDARPLYEHSRRRVLTGAIVGIGGTVLLAATGSGSAAAAESVGASTGGSHRRKAKGSALRNAGVGMHCGPDTGFGISTFTLNRNSVTCGVGSLGNSPGVVPMTESVPTGLAMTGPFAMLMYATAIHAYEIDRGARQIVATGVMRSITAVGNQTIEDTEHDFVCVGIDNRNRSADIFHLHFGTPFWSPASNPMATPSSYRKDWAMFGSTIVLGEINVG